MKHSATHDRLKNLLTAHGQMAENQFEEIHDQHNPTDEEVAEYAVWLGADSNSDRDLFWIAREALVAELPPGWDHLRDETQFGCSKEFLMFAPEVSGGHVPE